MAFIPPSADWISQAIKSAIDKEVEQVIEEEIIALNVRIAKRVRGNIGKIATTVLERMSFERRGTDLVIRVEIDENAKARS